MDQESDNLTEEERLAQEWAAAADSDANPMSQDEIDSLLGVSNQEQKPKSGLDEILTSAMVSYERLPMLEVVFDRFVRVVSTSLRNFTSDNVDVSLEKIQTLRFGDYLNSIPLPAMIGVFKAEEWDDCGLLTVDTPLIYSVIEVLLGGRRSPHDVSIQGRPYTTIERSLVEKMVHVILSDLSASFDPISAVTFRFERLEINPRFATITKAASASVHIRIKVEMDGRGGFFDILIPLSTLEPVREILLQMFMGEKFGRDSIWETHLASELWFTEIMIEAVLAHKTINLSEVLNWEKGSFLDLEVPTDPSIELACGGMPLFLGKLGQKNRNIAIQLENRILKEN